MQFAVDGDHRFPEGTGDRQEFQAALLERRARVVNEYKCFCHVSESS
jgi:hypothetical protein